MFVRAITLSLAAVLAAGMLSGEASADHRKKQQRAYVEDEYYAGPAFIRRVPGLRIFFGDYALTEEEFDALYGNDRRRYSEPEDAPPVKRKSQEKKKTAAKPAKPAKDDAGERTASISKDEGTTGAAAKKAPSSAMTCEKATSVVSGYGFSSVTAQSCTGKVYAFNATRDGKNFSVKLDSGSGELTEVKKLP